MSDEKINKESASFNPLPPPFSPRLSFIKELKYNIGVGEGCGYEHIQHCPFVLPFFAFEFMSEIE